MPRIFRWLGLCLLWVSVAQEDFPEEDGVLVLTERLVCEWHSPSFRQVMQRGEHPIGPGQQLPRKAQEKLPGGLGEVPLHPGRVLCSMVWAL